MFDVVVVGARVAGAAVAMALARRGHSVLCVDRVTFPSDTISTHYMRQVALARMRDWGVLDRLRATGCAPIRKITMAYRDIEFTGFSDPIDGITETYAPRRTALDAMLVGAAVDHGVEFRGGTTVTDLVWDEGAVAGIVAQDGDGHEYVERARLVIGADGKGSTVADLVGAQRYDVVPAVGFNYYSYFSGLDLHCQSRIGDGAMVGAWPTNDGQTIVWQVLPLDRFGAYRRDVERSFHETLVAVAPQMAEQVASGHRDERFYGTRYADNFYRESHGPGWALVGDAGYHKDPFTGLGISDAFEWADVLADHADAGLSGEAPMEASLADYQRIRDAETEPLYRYTCAAASMVLPDKHVAVMRALQNRPEYIEQWFRMMGGGLSGQQFFARENLAPLMSRAA